MRLTLVCSSLSSGGAERVMSTMANYWAQANEQVTFITLEDEATDFYKLDPRVQRVSLSAVISFTHRVQLPFVHINVIRHLRQAIDNSHPQVVISFIDRINIQVLLATYGTSIPIIISERTDPRMSAIGKHATVWNILRNFLYPHASFLVVQNQSVFDFFKPKIQQVTRIIPNPLSITMSSNMGEEYNIGNKDKGKKIIAMGRLTEPKGFDLLLHAFAQVAAKHAEWSLDIWGEGELRTELESLCVKLALQERVTLPGRTRNPYHVMQQADLFVLSSRFEGFPNVLCEAMGCGLAVISFDCPSGPRYIIRNGVDGILVPDGSVTALAAAMDRLMSNTVERQSLGTHALEILDRFNIDKIMELWNQLVDQAIKKTQGRDHENS